MSVKDYVRKSLEQKRNNEGEPTKFTVALNPYNIRRLDYVAQLLDTPRSALARDLIIQALNDIAVELDLKEVDFDATIELREDISRGLIEGEEDDVVLTPYGEWVRNGVPINHED